MINSTQDAVSFFIKMVEGARGQDSGETEREQGRESECRLTRDMVSVIKRTVRNVLIECYGNIWQWVVIN
jgi:hypothetical protein